MINADIFQITITCRRAKKRQNNNNTREKQEVATRIVISCVYTMGTRTVVLYYDKINYGILNL